MPWFRRSSVLDEINALQRDAVSAHTYLTSDNFSEFKEKLQEIMSLDIQLLKRVHREEGSILVLHDCGEVLNNAKNAFKFSHKMEARKTLGFRNRGRLSKLVQRIENLLDEEKHQELSFEEEEKQLRAIWGRYFRPGIVYHGTSTASIGRIERYGLVPNMKPWDPADLKIAQRISHDFDRIGITSYVGGDPSKGAQESDTTHVSLTGLKTIAKRYALFEKSQNLRVFLQNLAWSVNNPNSQLTRQQINILKRMQAKYTAIQKNSKSVVLHISIRKLPPREWRVAVSNLTMSYDDVLDFDKFDKKFRKYLQEKPKSSFLHFLSDAHLMTSRPPYKFGIGPIEFTVEGRISRDAIVKIEYL